MKLGVLGGTFDPIHNGHVAAAAAAQQALGSTAIMLIPSRIPPHRHDPVGATGRAALRDGAARGGGASGLVGVARSSSTARGRRTRTTRSAELARIAARRESNGTQIFFITGADAFAEIATWSRYPAVLDLANFVVVSRPGITLDSLRDRVPSAFRDRPSASNTRDSGRSAHSRHFVDRHPAARPRRPQPLRFRAGSRRPLHRGASSLLWTLDLHGKDH